MAITQDPVSHPARWNWCNTYSGPTPDRVVWQDGKTDTGVRGLSLRLITSDDNFSYDCHFSQRHMSTFANYSKLVYS